MANIPGSLNYMTDVEIAADAPVTESLLTKIGANINGLLDLAGNSEVFTSNGTFNVPENVTRVFVTGIGGGGGGGSSNTTRGGTGGGSGVNKCVAVAVTPLASIAVTIGSGGASNANGSATTFGALVTFSGGEAGETVSPGANTGRGGRGGSNGGNTDPSGLTGGHGGGGFSLGGAGGAINNAGGSASANTGSGGGGAGRANAGTLNGGSGGSGYLAIFW